MLRRIITPLVILSMAVSIVSRPLTTSHARGVTLFFTVNTTSDVIIPGACINSLPGCSLRGAITAATEDDAVIQIDIPPSDPFCTDGVCTINLIQPMNLITESMSIKGPGADKLIVRLANGVEGSVFTMAGPSPIILIEDLTISGGNSSTGGGIAASTVIGVQITIRRCVISGNSAPNGGGIFTKATMRIQESLITGNGTGGIVNSGGALRISNSTIAANTGRGIENLNNGTLTVTNSTIAFNTSGSGITNTSGVASVKSSIIAHNSSTFLSDVTGPFVSAGFNLVGKRDGGTGFTQATDLTGTILSPLDPRFDPGGLQNNGARSKSITLVAGSPAIDKGSSNGLDGILSTDQRGVARTYDFQRTANATGGDGTDIGALERRTSPYDFDGDGRTDVSIFRPGPAEWWYLRSSTGGNAAFQFGQSTDKITPADFTGDGRSDIAFWRPSNGNWFVLRSEDFSFFAFAFGTVGDIPAPADYDDDGRADAAVFRPSSGTWFISQTGGGGVRIVQFGANGDQPVVADYDNDGAADIGIARANGSVMEWWINRSTAGLLAMQFGTPTDKPVQGDYTADGKADVAFFRPSTGEWFVVRSQNLTFFSFPFGTIGDIPSPGDYDGDAMFDATVFRPSSATWFIARTGAGTQIVQFGVNGDRPVPNAFVP